MAQVNKGSFLVKSFVARTQQKEVLGPITVDQKGSERRSPGTGEGKGRDVVVMGFTEDPKSVIQTYS